jgi:hypothetical protein
MTKVTAVPLIKREPETLAIDLGSQRVITAIGQYASGANVPPNQPDLVSTMAEARRRWTTHTGEAYRSRFEHWNRIDQMYLFVPAVT